MSEGPTAVPDRRTSMVQLAVFMACPTLLLATLLAELVSFYVAGMALVIMMFGAALWAQTYWSHPDRRSGPTRVTARIGLLCAPLGLPARPFAIAWWSLLAISLGLFGVLVFMQRIV